MSTDCPPAARSPPLAAIRRHPFVGSAGARIGFASPLPAVPVSRYQGTTDLRLELPLRTPGRVSSKTLRTTRGVTRQPYVSGNSLARHNVSARAAAAPPRPLAQPAPP